MTEKIKIYLIGFDEASPFTCDIYSSKKIKMLGECNVKLDAVFAKNFNNFPVVKRYCLEHEIESINLEKGEQSYFLNVARYHGNHPDKKNLAALVPSKISLNLDFLFKQDPYFYSHIIRWLFSDFLTN